MSYKKSGIIISVVILVVIIIVYCIFGIEVKDTESPDRSTPNSLSSSSINSKVESKPQEVTSKQSEVTSKEITESKVASKTESSKVESSKIVSTGVNSSKVESESSIKSLDSAVSLYNKGFTSEMIEIDPKTVVRGTKERVITGLVSSKHMYYYDSQVYYQFEIISADGKYFKYFVPEQAYKDIKEQSSVKLKVRDYTVKDEIVTCVLSVETMQ